MTFVFLILSLTFSSFIHGEHVIFIAIDATSHISQIYGLAVAFAQQTPHSVTLFVNGEKKSVVFEGREGNEMATIECGVFPHPPQYYNYAQDLPNFLLSQNDISMACFSPISSYIKHHNVSMIVFDHSYPLG
jgi:hypothetical protein